MIVHRKRSARSAGYTLIEILVVLLIISVVTGIAVLSIHHNKNKQLESFAREITQLLLFAEDYALLQSVQVGWSIEKQRLQLHVLKMTETQTTAWIPLQEKIFNKHRIPEKMQLLLKTPHRKDKAGLPSVLISMSREMTPFTLYVGYKGEAPRYAVIGEVDGRIHYDALS